MNLFHLQEEARGSVFWHPKGWTLSDLSKSYMRMRLEDAGYVEVKTRNWWTAPFGNVPGIGKSSVTICLLPKWTNPAELPGDDG